MEPGSPEDVLRCPNCGSPVEPEPVRFVPLWEISCGNCADLDFQVSATGRNRAECVENWLLVCENLKNDEE